nr:PREDICTED: TMV resistance protein N-like isoform X1 [Daucus carota subsp. sativus]
MDTSKQVVLIWDLPVLTIIVILAIIIHFVSKKKHMPSKNTTSSLHLADPFCSSSSSSPPTWDVFLSFHGKDTRSNFISHLYHALCQAGIQTFIDDHALEKGQEISSTLLDAIRKSNMFIIVLSENYASSRWCLDELAEILSCKRTEKQVVPVFYYVDPSDVRHQKGSFGKALDRHMKRYSNNMIVKWKSALFEIAKLSGHHLRSEANEKESATIQDIVGNVAPRATTKALHVEKYLFGIESAVEEIYQKLRLESDDVRAIGLCGMGGIGKTTIAKAFYNLYFNKFDISCFSVSVEQYSQGGSPLLQLIQQLLINLLRKNDYKVPDVESGIRKLKHILHSKKALIVLDDLDCANCSELLANIGNLFSAGSKIIITTRDANLLYRLKADISEVDTYKVKTLGLTESLELFNYHAFRNTVSPESFKELCLSFVTHAGGLPLALKVLGSSLLGKTDESFWKDKLENVKAIPENNIQKILQLSYDGLDDEMQKAIFLDIAFFFVGKDKDEAADVFKSCGFFPGVGIPNLVDRCLLTVDKDNKLQMHNLIQDMGRELGKTTRTRLFFRGNECKRLFLRGNDCKDSQYLEQEGCNIEGLVLDLTTSTDGEMTTLLFERMSNLRLLQILGPHDIKGNFTNLFPNLRCIRWHSSPWTHIPSVFCPKHLISIDMPSSKFKVLWKVPMPLKQLSSLGCLYLSQCGDLKQLPDQLGEIKGLKMIDVSYTAIEKLPDSVTHLKKLIQLNLRSCKKLANLPEQLGDMKALRELDAGSSAIEKLPDSITQLKELFKLSLFGCKNLRNIPEQIGNIESLRTFDAGGTAIEQLPDSFGGLVNLERLELDWCKSLKNLPNNIWKLKLLKQLYLGKCPKLERLPEQLGKMQCLESLSADGTAIKEVPDSIRLLSRLQVLNLGNCKKLEYVPESIWNLTSVERLDLEAGNMGIVSIPKSVEKLNKLTSLDLSCNVRLCLPMILRFPSLQELTLTDEGQILSSAEPVSLSGLLNLQELTMNKCTSLGSSLPELPLNLKGLYLCDHSSLEQLPDLSSLKLLKRLFIERCSSLQSISLLPPLLRTLSVEECTSLQDLPDLSLLKKLVNLRFVRCNNLKSISLKQSILQGRPSCLPFYAYLPNREVAEWFDFKSSGHAVSFDIPPCSGSNLLGLALWLVFTCKPTHLDYPYMRAIITNITEGTTENYPIFLEHLVVGETQSRIECITPDKISIRSGDKIKVSIRSKTYLDHEFKKRIGEVKINMFGVHLAQDGPKI